MVASIAGATAAASSSSSAHAAAGGRRAKREPASMHAGGIRRSRSEPHLRCSRRGGSAGAALTTSRSIGVFPFQFGAAPLRPPPLPEADGCRPLLTVCSGETDPDPDPEMPQVSTPEDHWLDALLELRKRFHDPTKRFFADNDGLFAADDDDDYQHVDGGCGVSYDNEEDAAAAAEEDDAWDRDSFGKLLARAPLAEARLFAQLAFLCNMAYVIPEIKEAELEKHYGLQLKTSSVKKKAEAGAISAKLDIDSTRPPAAAARTSTYEVSAEPQPRRPVRRSNHLAYEVAASAASYVQARARGLLSLGGGRRQGQPPAAAGSPEDRLYNSGMAAYVAASTVTAVVAAEDEARQEAARDLRSPLSSPCEWFACAEADRRTLCFVIQGSDSVASWQANLLFEPTDFEGTGVLVHRGIYEAAKGIYDQLMPEIQQHLASHKGAAPRLRFTGHSLGGSLALLVSLMLVSRGVVDPESLLPVVTFGAPSVFCGGQRVLDALGVGEAHVRAVAMHRDIVPRAFSCRYPGHAVALLKRLNGALRTHPCLNSQKVLYTPMGRTYILQPDGKASPRHPFLPEGAALYRVDPEERAGAAERDLVASAMRAFLNSPHPLETLSDLAAYGSEGAILRDHESGNYFRALYALSKVAPRRRKKQPEIVWRLPGVERLQQYWWPGVAGSVLPRTPVAVPVRNKELVSEA